MQMARFISLTIILFYISRCSGETKNDIDIYLNEREVRYSADTDELTVSFRFTAPVINGLVYDKNVSVKDHDFCGPVQQQTDDYYTYVFAYDGTSPCQGNKTILDELRTRYHITLNFVSWRDGPLGLTIYLFDTNYEFEIIVTTKPTHIPSTLEIASTNPVMEPMTGDVVDIIVGYNDTETIWDELLVQTCTVANNEEFSNDVERNLHSEVAFLNGCPESISTGDVLTEQKRVQDTFTLSSIGWTVVGFNYGEDKLWLRCEVELCNIRGDCELPPSCSSTGRQSVAESRNPDTVTATVQFSVEGIQYPTTPTVETPSTEPTPSTTPDPANTPTPSTPFTPTPTPFTPTPSTPLGLSMSFYVDGSADFEAVEGNFIQLRITRSSESLTEMMLESCQISNNINFNYIPSQQQFTDNFILENCPQMAVMEVKKPEFTGNNALIDLKAFKYSTGTAVHFRCNVIGCTAEDATSCQPENECIVADGRRRSLISTISKSPHFETITGTLVVAEGPSSAAVCPDGEICTETVQFASMVGVLGFVVVVAVAVVIVEVFRVSKYKQKLKYEKRRHIDGYENYEGPAGAAGGGSGRDGRGAGSQGGRAFY